MYMWHLGEKWLICSLCVCVYRSAAAFHLEEVWTKKEVKWKMGVTLMTFCVLYFKAAAAAAIMYVLRHYRLFNFKINNHI